jgi:hypothetical protein
LYVFIFHLLAKFYTLSLPSFQPSAFDKKIQKTRIQNENLRTHHESTPVKYGEAFHGTGEIWKARKNENTRIKAAFSHPLAPPPRASLEIPEATEKVIRQD